MKIGILSMQRVVNYGSFLQALGLKILVESLGHQVLFVDIENGENVDFGTSERGKIGYKKYKGLRKIVAVMDRYFVKRCIGQVYQKRLEKLFRIKQQSVLGVNESVVNDITCDVLVIGSDEVFNCVQPSPWGVALQLFGKYPYAKKVITYAASCGYTRVDMIPKEIQKQIGDALQNVAQISVRDRNTFDFVEQLTSVQASYHLDPVLMADYSSVETEYKIKKNYVLVYAYTNRINLPEEIVAIKEFARKKGLITVSIGGYQCWCDKNLLVEPEEVFSVFRNAKYIVTDTFHGCVIASKMNRPFVSIARDGNKEKMIDYLERVGLRDRLLYNIDELEIMMEKDIDYNQFNKIIYEQRMCAFSYLKDNLSKDK